MEEPTTAATIDDVGTEVPADIGADEEADDVARTMAAKTNPRKRNSSQSEAVVASATNAIASTDERGISRMEICRRCEAEEGS